MRVVVFYRRKGKWTMHNESQMVRVPRTWVLRARTTVWQPDHPQLSHGAWIIQPPLPEPTTPNADPND